MVWCLFSGNAEVPPDALTCLPSYGIRYAVQAGGATKPGVPVQRDPATELVKVVAQVGLEGPYRPFGLRLWVGYRVESAVGREEANSSVRIQEPIAPTREYPDSGLNAHRLMPRLTR